MLQNMQSEKSSIGRSNFRDLFTFCFDIFHQESQNTLQIFFSIREENKQELSEVLLFFATLNRLATVYLPPSLQTIFFLYLCVLLYGSAREQSVLFQKVDKLDGSTLSMGLLIVVGLFLHRHKPNLFGISSLPDFRWDTALQRTSSQCPRPAHLKHYVKAILKFSFVVF